MTVVEQNSAKLVEIVAQEKKVMLTMTMLYIAILTKLVKSKILNLVNLFGLLHPTSPNDIHQSISTVGAP